MTAICYQGPFFSFGHLINASYMKQVWQVWLTYTNNSSMLPPEFNKVLLTGYREHAHCWVDDKAIFWNSRLQLINKAYRAAITQEVNWMLQVPELIMLATDEELFSHGWR